MSPLNAGLAAHKPDAVLNFNKLLHELVQAPLLVHFKSTYKKI